MLTTAKKQSDQKHASKRQRCVQCGSKNPPEAERCRTCTRPLGSSPNPTEQAFDDRLWMDPISEKPKGSLPVVPLLVVLLLVALATANYFVWGLGPSWTHREQADEKGSMWRTWEGEPGLRVQLPGNPTVSDRPTSAGRMTFVTVGIDAHWDSVLDADTVSPDAIDQGRRNLLATVVIADAGSPNQATPPVALATAALDNGRPAVTVTGVTPGDTTTSGAQTRTPLSATTQSSSQEANGRHVDAVVVSTPTRTVIVMAFFADKEDPELVPALVSRLAFS